MNSARRDQIASSDQFFRPGASQIYQQPEDLAKALQKVASSVWRSKIYDGIALG
jgi:hypothetical protein